LAYDIAAGDEITASRLVDTGISVVLSIVAFSNPVVLVALAVYTVADSYGAFDDLKSYVGGDKVIINKRE
tara:strand:+ start:163 stop:372 length:210 start_codon:yes stop_codon:yes gene_type:complete